MRYVLKTFTLLFSFLFILSVSADYGFKVDNVDENSASLSWDSSEKAPYSMVLYGKKPDAESKYTEKSDMLSENTLRLGNLKEATQYYFSLEGYNEEGKKIFRSEEISATTAGLPDNAFDVKTENTDTENSFALLESFLGDDSTLYLQFNHDLDTEKIANTDFKIQNSAGEDMVIELEKLEIVEGKKNILKAKLANEFIKGEEYKVTIITIADINGNNIEFGIDSESAFRGGDFQKFYQMFPKNKGGEENPEELELNSAGPSEKQNTQTPEENTQNEETASTGSQNQENNEKKEVKQATETMKKDLAKNVETASKEKKDLPKTGPEHVLLFIVALLASAAIFGFTYKKS